MNSDRIAFLKAQVVDLGSVLRNMPDSPARDKMMQVKADYEKELDQWLALPKPKAPPKKQETSRLVKQLVDQLYAADLVPVWEEHRFHPSRRWRFDLAWPDLKLAVEVHGGVWTQGRHTRGAGFSKDREKMNEAILLGWRVLEVTGDQVQSGQALDWIERALEGEL